MSTAQCPYQTVNNPNWLNSLYNEKLPLESERYTSIYFSLLFPLISTSQLCVLSNSSSNIENEMKWVEGSG